MRFTSFKLCSKTTTRIAPTHPWMTGRAYRAGTAATRPTRTTAPSAKVATKMFAVIAPRHASTATGIAVRPAKYGVTSVTSRAAPRVKRRRITPSCHVAKIAFAPAPLAMPRSPPANSTRIANYVLFVAKPRTRQKPMRPITTNQFPSQRLERKFHERQEPNPASTPARPSTAHLRAVGLAQASVLLPPRRDRDRRLWHHGQGRSTLRGGFRHGAPADLDDDRGDGGR